MAKATFQDCRRLVRGANQLFALLPCDGVNGFAVGRKRVAGSDTDDLAIIVFVSRKLTLERLPIYAVLGGFHLAGPKFEPRISTTVAAVKDYHPSFVIPSHCTGWKAMYRFAREIPHAFVYPGTGKLYRFFSG